MKPYKAVLFDLDGTLLDTIDDLADAMNSVLTDMNLPTYPVAEYNFLVGDGIRVLAERVLPAARQDEETIARCVDGMRAAYERRWANKSKPYDGVPALLDALTERGLTLVVLSNKPDEFTKKVVARLLSGWHFEEVVGARPEVPIKPDPAGAIEITQILDIPPDQFLYLGDTNTDMKTAVAAGMYPVGALWGFRPAEELTAAGARTLIKHPMELEQIVNGDW